MMMKVVGIWVGVTFLLVLECGGETEVATVAAPEGTSVALDSSAETRDDDVANDDVVGSEQKDGLVLDGCGAAECGVAKDLECICSYACDGDQHVSFRCFQFDGATYKCSCMLNGLDVRSCVFSAPPQDWKSACEFGTGCCR